MEKKKYVLCIFFFLFFGDVIIHKTGTMLATGQGPIATPSGSESVTDGNGVRDPGVTVGAEEREGEREGREERQRTRFQNKIPVRRWHAGPTTGK